MALLVVIASLCVAVSLPAMARGETATSPDNHHPTPPQQSPAAPPSTAHPQWQPSPPPPPPCPQGLQWSPSTQQCCPLCPAGTGATGACVSPAFAASSPGSSGSREDVLSEVSQARPRAVVGDRGYNNITSRGNNNTERHVGVVVKGCEVCPEGTTTSSSEGPHTDRPCRTCSTCPKHARAVRACNSTHDTVCQCREAGLFYMSERTGDCELCDLCPAGWGARRPCGGSGGGNTVCHKCLNGTFSKALSATAPCQPCSAGCGEGQKMLRGCSATEDVVCIDKYMDIPPMYRFNGNSGGNRHHDFDLAQDHLNGDGDGDDDRHRGQKRPGEGRRSGGDDDDGGIDVIPLYCAALGAVVVGLLAYVAFVHYRRMRDKRLSREPHEDVEYSKASAGGGDSGVFVDPDHHQHHHHHQQQQQQQQQLHQQQQQNKCQSAVITGSSRIRDLSQSKRKELEKTCLAGSRGPADWKGLARELGYNSGKIASFEPRGGSQRDPGAPYRHVLQDWSRLEGATVAALLRALRNSGRHDVVKFLQAECAEQLQPLTATLPHNVV